MSSSPVVIILAAYNIAERIWDFWTSNGNAIAFFLFVYMIAGAIFWEQDSVHECRGTESFNHYFFPGSVFSQLEIPEKGNFEGYFGSLYIVFIHWSRYWYGLVSWWYPSDILVIIYGNFLIYELFNLYQCRALYRRIKQTEKTKQELARSLKTATSKVSQLEVSNSLSKAVL